MQAISRIWVLGLFFIPFFFISGIPHQYVYPKVIFFQIWVGIGLLIFLFFKKREGNVEFGLVQLGFISLCVLSLFSIFWVSDLPSALFGSFWRGTGLIFYLSLILGSIVLNETTIRKDFFAVALISCGTLMSFIIFYYYNFVSPAKANTVLMGNPNPLSYWLGTTIFVNLIFRHLYTGKTKILFYLVNLICFTAMTYLGSRSSIGGTLLGLLFIGIFANKKALKFSGFGILGVSILLAGQYFLQKSSILSNMISRTSDFHRLGVWQGAWDSFLAKPILGYGNYGLLQGYWHNYTSTLGKGLEWNDNAHSIVFNILGEQGLSGIIIFIATLYFILKLIFKKDTQDKCFWVGFFVFTACYFLFQPYYVDASLLTLLVLFLFKDEVKFVLKPNNPYFIGAKLMFAVLLIFISFKQISQIGLINQTRVDIVNNENFRKPWDKYMSQTSYLDKAGVMRQLNKQMKATLGQNFPRFERYKKQFPKFMTKEYPKVIKLQPSRPRALENYADWLNRNKEHQKALMTLDKILAKSSNIPRVYKIKAQIYEEIKQYKKSKEMLLKAKELNPDYMTLDNDLKYIEKLIRN